MSDQSSDEPVDGDDDALIGAGHRLRDQIGPLDAGAVAIAALRRRTRRLGMLSAALATVLVVCAVAVGVMQTNGSSQMASGRDTVDAAHLDAFLAGLPAKPIDPSSVKLVASVRSFPGCDALIGNLRAVGARHVGSQGFGGFSTGRFAAVGAAVSEAGVKSDSASSGNMSADSGTAAGDTVGTNVQVSGVDELDRVKAVGNRIYDLDGRGNLRITDADHLNVVSTTAVAAPINAAKGVDGVADVETSTSSLLVDGDRIAVFGTQSELSKPVAGDPSASQSSTGYLTVTFLDATDPAHPRITDRVKVEGSLVAARLVGGQIRLVTTSQMDDIGMVMPTTPASIPTALERNRRSVATSTVDDWIPNWQREGSDPQPLVPCDRVHVPATFAGVSMTSMVTFPIGTGRFDPAGTSIVAPSTTLYAGLDKVAISSQVWVDPADQQRLRFHDWQTAIHEFTFPESGAPSYVGSGIVDGSTVGQFAFGELGSAIAVVSAQGTPWDQRTDDAVDLTLLTPNGHGDLEETSKVGDLADGRGEVSAVRYLGDRVLISTGEDGRDVQVIDVSNPSAPTRAGKVTLAGPTGYFHPLSGDRALLVGSRVDDVPGPHGPIPRTWARAELLDVSNAADPKLTGSWETSWASDQVGEDHHAFTFWPKRNLAMWGVSNVRDDGAPNHAIVLSVGDSLHATAWPQASEPPEVAAPCPQIPFDRASIGSMLGPDTVVLGCPTGQHREIEWPRWVCSSISDDLVLRYAPDRAGAADYFQCSPAPAPTVERVLVVDGRPILMTDQTLEALDPDTFASVAIVYHPSDRYSSYPVDMGTG